MAELAGTIKVGILLGIEATEGNCALWVVGVPCSVSVGGALVDSDADGEAVRLATIKPDAVGV
jgi:hypothetical protein